MQISRIDSTLKSVNLVRNNEKRINNTNSSYQANSILAPNVGKSIVSPTYYHSLLSNISFNGRLDWEEIARYSNNMGKRIYSKRHVTEMAEFHSDSSGITAGRGVPEVWTKRIKDITKFDKDSFIQDLGAIFAKEREFADLDLLHSNLTDLFKKHKIITDDKQLSVDYIGRGFQAWAYKIAIDNDDESAIVVKLFKRLNNFLQNHGNHTEQNLAEYVKASAGDETEFVKYHFGDTKNGIMVVDYLSPNTTKKPISVRDLQAQVSEDLTLYGSSIAKTEANKPEYIRDLSDLGIAYCDGKNNRNMMNGMIYDFGGIETLSNLMGNKTAQKVHFDIKYAKTPELGIAKFNEVFSRYDDSDIAKNEAVGLVHSVKHLPEEMHLDMFKKLYGLGSNRVNIALIQNFRYMDQFDKEYYKLMEDLTTNVKDVKIQETIAKCIATLPQNLRFKFFEEFADTKVSAIIKYLGRNINYSKPGPDRLDLYRNFVKNSDSYASVALINVMNKMSEKRYDEYFESFFNKNDVMINTALARNLEHLSHDTKLQQKWIDKLYEIDDVQVRTALCESIEFIDRDLRADLFERLLPIKDRVAKEFLAQNIALVPGHAQHPEWVEQLLDGADNMVRGSLVNTINSMKDGITKDKWSKLVLDGADESIKKMLNKGKEA